MTNAIRIIEIVGPPGSGKTALANALKKRRSDVIEVEIFPYFRETRHIPLFARNLICLLPTLFHLWRYKVGFWLSKRDVTIMTILAGWDVALNRQALENGKIIVLEEGAVCLLAKLLGFGSGLLREHAAAHWWNEMYRNWAETLDLVIVLRPPIQTMVERIRTREQQFEFGDMKNVEAAQYLESIQCAQERVLFAMNATPGSPKIIQFDTLDKQPDQIAIEIMALL